MLRDQMICPKLHSLSIAFQSLSRPQPHHREGGESLGGPKDSQAFCFLRVTC